MSRRSSNQGSRLVYSTEQPVEKPSKSRAGGKKKRGATKPPGLPDDGIVRVWLQSKGRKGKGVTAITGLDLAPDELTELASELKKACGSGGTVKRGTVEIQGDHREYVVEELRRRGWRVKKAGG